MSNLDNAIESARQHLEAVANDLKSDPRLAKIKKLHAAVNQLEEIAGCELTSMAAILDFGKMPDFIPTRQDNFLLRIEPHDFYGLEPLDAAKKYLKKVGPMAKSASFTEILTGVRSGGGDPGNEDKLRLSLTRSTYEVAKIGDDRYGLIEFFPHIKRGTPGRKKKSDVETSTSEAPGPAEKSEEINQAEEASSEAEPVEQVLP
jgi:hypothetical protein